MKPDVVFGLENAPWPALLVDSRGKILLRNAAARTLFGPAVEGDGAMLETFWHPENGRRLPETLSYWEQSPAPLAPHKFRTAALPAETLNVAACPFSRGGEKVVVLQLFTASMPAQPLTASRPAAAQDDTNLQHKLDCIMQLARTFSLDFNNALTGVLGHTSLLLEKAEGQHPWKRALIEIEKSAVRAAEIAADLAQFSRREKEAPRIPPGNLNAVATRCAEAFQQVHGAGIQWKLGLEQRLFGARFDEAKIHQALTKIVENAVESFDQRGGQVAIQTRNVELTEPTQDRNVRLNAGTYVCVEVSDCGAGIAPDALSKIFEPFFTTKRPPHRGLGLAIVYGIVSNHGGGVAISSQPGAGTSARIYLPAERTCLADAAKSDGELRGSGTILVVDDETLMLTMADIILTEYGYKVLTASDGQKALALLSKPGTAVDLVITDLIMPGMGGRELAEKIHQLIPSLPVISTSGYVMPENQKGQGDYLQKPFTSGELLQKVKRGIASRRG